ncbi:FHA domain-containing protein [Kitasatospora purpeofusca]|uniref:FHA domain-containing protein n=1 Tax=Kitasatospora purpeofusca TaxID=67352 RepID=UPI002A59C785|nr:FHA domain-containing protein [Kitasatospora purpeofusca]MDY0810695.1 FHA domain-containing protein [Kitasatospora purpeofusca]
MATVIYRCPVGAPGECPPSATRGYCQVHMFQQLERHDPAEDLPPAGTPAGTPTGTPADTPPAPGTAAATDPEAATRPARPPRPTQPPEPQRPSGPRPQQHQQRPQPRPGRPPVARLALVVAGVLLPVRAEHRRGGGGLAIGRDEPDCAAIPGLPGLDQLSRHHARLRWIDGALYVEDLRSTNGTFVDGRRIEEPTRIGPGCRLRFALDLDVQVVEIDEFGAPR